MASVSRRLRHLTSKGVPSDMPRLPVKPSEDLNEKIKQILVASQQLTTVSTQIEAVNGQLKNLDVIGQEIRAARDLIEEVMVELTRQRYVTLKLFEQAVPAPRADLLDLESRLRAEFDAQQPKNPQ